jgi:hypothetical protein
LNRRGARLQAKETFAEALEMQKKIYRGDHPELAASMSNVGLVMHRS